MDPLRRLMTSGFFDLGYFHIIDRNDDGQYTPNKDAVLYAEDYPFTKGDAYSDLAAYLAPLNLTLSEGRSLAGLAHQANRRAALIWASSGDLAKTRQNLARAQPYAFDPKAFEEEKQEILLKSATEFLNLSPSQREWQLDSIRSEDLQLLREIGGALASPAAKPKVQAIRNQFHHQVASRRMSQAEQAAKRCDYEGAGQAMAAALAASAGVGLAVDFVRLKNIHNILARPACADSALSKKKAEVKVRLWETP